MTARTPTAVPPVEPPCIPACPHCKQPLRYVGRSDKTGRFHFFCEARDCRAVLGPVAYYPSQLRALARKGDQS